MSIVLIVVATSAILELVQSIIPINQMISATLLGILIVLVGGGNHFKPLFQIHLIFEGT